MKKRKRRYYTKTLTLVFESDISDRCMQIFEGVVESQTRIFGIKIVRRFAMRRVRRISK